MLPFRDGWDVLVREDWTSWLPGICTRNLLNVDKVGGYVLRLHLLRSDEEELRLWRVLWQEHHQGVFVLRGDSRKLFARSKIKIELLSPFPLTTPNSLSINLYVEFCP